MTAVPATLQAEERALRQYLADLPDPARYAEGLPANLALLLLTAIRKRDGSHTVTEPVAQTLRRYGLCECSGRCLTNFGVTVMKILRQMDRL